MYLRKGLIIDPTFKGNLARFINHSCQPNCKAVLLDVGGLDCIGIYALVDIKEDEELAFNYSFDQA